MKINWKYLGFVVSLTVMIGIGVGAGTILAQAIFRNWNQSFGTIVVSAMFVLPYTMSLYSSLEFGDKLVSHKFSLGIGITTFIATLVLHAMCQYFASSNIPVG
jgi:hypothetical protein